MTSLEDEPKSSAEDLEDAGPRTSPSKSVVSVTFVPASVTTQHDSQADSSEDDSAPTSTQGADEQGGTPITTSDDFLRAITVAGSFRCPNPFGWFRDPISCDHFYQCTGGRGIRMLCPEGMHFNKRVNVCDLIEDAHCIDSF